MAHPTSEQNKRMLDEFVGDDEWDDLPLANRSPSRPRLQSPRPPAPGLSPCPNPAVRASATMPPVRNGTVLQLPPGSKPRSPVVRKPQQQRLLQSTSNSKSRRKLKTRQQRPPKPGSSAAARPPTKPTTTAASKSRATVVAARSSTGVLPTGRTMPAVAPKLNGAHVQNGNKTDDRSRSGCRKYEAGFCSQGDRDCPLLHDGRTAVEKELTWLRAPLPGIMDWRYFEELRFQHNGVLPAIHPGVPQFLVIVDTPNKQNVPEFVCLAMETCTGRQVGRFRRLVRVSPQPSPSPKQQSLPGAPPNVFLANGGATPGNAVSGSVSATTGATLVLPAAGAASGVKPNQGSRNPVSTALPLPELLLELQRWMVALGLDPGLQDDKGFSECGNFRWIVCGDLSLTMIPELAGQRENLPIPAHLRSWTDLARVCAWEADAHQAWYDSVAQKSLKVVARRKPKQHCLPRSGLGGMLKFLGPPKGTNTPDRTRRGVESVITLAQCVACLLRAGVTLPITTRVTQLWNPIGKYEETRCEEVHVLPPARTFSVPCNAVSVVGPLASPVLDLSPSKGPTNGRVGGGGGGGGVNRLEIVEGGNSKKKKKKERNASKTNRMEAGGRGGGGGTLGMNVPAGMREGMPGGGAGVVLGRTAPKMMAPVGGITAPVGGGGIAGVSVEVVGLPNWRRSVPVHALSPDYLDYSIREKEREFYKSAGILPYRHDPVTGEAWILVGSEVRRDKLVLSCLGGKRENRDPGPEHTAWREFWEESGKVLSDNDRTTFLSACFEGRARAMWIQSAKMAVMACELNSPGFVDLPRWYTVGGRSIDKGDTSMIALHWVSATELHRACSKNGRKVTVWMPPRKPGDPGGPPAPKGVMVAPRMSAQSMPAPNPQQPWHKGPTQRNFRGGYGARGRDMPWGGRGAEVGDLDDVSVGGDLEELHDGPGPGAPFMPGGHGGPPGPVLSLPLQLPLPKRAQQVKQQQQQQQEMVPISMVQVALEPYYLLRTLVADPAFQLFFAQLAAAGKSNQRFVPPSRMMNNGGVAHGGGGSSRMGTGMPAF